MPEEYLKIPEDSLGCHKDSLRIPKDVQRVPKEFVWILVGFPEESYDFSRISNEFLIFLNISVGFLNNSQ